MAGNLSDIKELKADFLWIYEEKKVIFVFFQYLISHMVVYQEP
jgi:hypothetical protein